MNGQYLLFTTVGELKFEEVVAECQEEGWVPVLIVRPPIGGGPPLIPVFPTREVALRFAQRNLPKGHLHGVTTLPDADMHVIRDDWIAKRGWRFEFLSYARRMPKDYTVDVEVLELTSKPDIYRLDSDTNPTPKIIFLAK